MILGQLALFVFRQNFRVLFTCIHSIGASGFDISREHNLLNCISVEIMYVYSNELQ
jgi:hypothetical protein